MLNPTEGSNIMESASKTLARKRVESIDDIEAHGIKLTESQYLESLMFHWWDKDDPYFYWDIK